MPYQVKQDQKEGSREDQGKREVTTVVQRKMTLHTFTFFFIIVSLIIIGNSHAQVRVYLVNTPNLIDFSRQNTLEVKGGISGADPESIVIRAAWRNQVDHSPPLQRDDRGQFKHTFSLGGDRCGPVRFEALVRVSNITIVSEPEYTFVDCQPPRIQVDNPIDGQLIKPYAPVPIELKVEDDMLSNSKYLPSSIVNSVRKYTLKVEVDGSPVQTHDISVLALGQAPVRKFNIPGLKPGQHAIRFSITDPSDKSDEKTIFVKADGTPPSVSITSPGNNDRITFGSGSVPSLNIAAQATDESGIDRVEFYLDGKGVGVANTPSGGNRYTISMGISEEGQKTITVKAFDKMGNSSQRSVTIFVSFMDKPKTIGPVPSPSKTLPGPQKTLPR